MTLCMSTRSTVIVHFCSNDSFMVEVSVFNNTSLFNSLLFVQNPPLGLVPICACFCTRVCMSVCVCVCVAYSV